MSKYNEIQAAIIQLNGGEFQKLCTVYLNKKYRSPMTDLGSKDGSNKTTKGTPDAYFKNPKTNRYICTMYGTARRICKKTR
ncbi:glutamate dehydrogenase [Granulicatella balaenopterae]|uniref:glutamate dehydrogenase n=1 Tax=Granulicatella balaenopterae TaxID=137733 RepID=UPI00115F9B18|nr:glutamate dehydrogenase [Granulicatella balaenopterae]